MYIEIILVKLLLIGFFFFEHPPRIQKIHIQVQGNAYIPYSKDIASSFLRHACSSSLFKCISCLRMQDVSTCESQEIESIHLQQTLSKMNKDML